MDEWRIHQQQQQQQQRMISGGVGPIHNYHSVRSRSSPYSLPHQMTSKSIEYDTIVKSFVSIGNYSDNTESQSKYYAYFNEK